jgi:hypothetical protein
MKTIYLKITVMMLFISGILFLSSCKKDDDPTPDPNTPPVASFEVTPVVGSSSRFNGKMGLDK